ncbi:hypothetical protein N184_32105 [Sinorhizobium sp. GL28]|nr:hypothetical protein N184_32105 [Sinorhizobium sp. GL28]
MILRNNDRQSRPIMDGLIQTLQSLPHLARRSITFDRGTEFTEWPYLQAGIGAQTWFCDPQSPWQKGTVENTNRRVRKWLSRDVDPLSITDDDLKVLDLSRSQIHRLLQAYDQDGPAGLVSKKRSRPSNRRHSEDFRNAALDLIRERYLDTVAPFSLLSSLACA